MGEVVVVEVAVVEEEVVVEEVCIEFRLGQKFHIDEDISCCFVAVFFNRQLSNFPVTFNILPYYFSLWLISQTLW